MARRPDPLKPLTEPGAASTCVSARPGEVPYGGWGTSKAPNSGEGVVGLRAGVTDTVLSVGVCKARASATEEALARVPFVAPVLLFLGFCALVLRISGAARHQGLFSSSVARRISWLGWFLLVGSTVMWLGETAAKTALLRQWVDDYDGSALAHFDVSVMIAGFATLAVGRVMERTVPMQEELDATV